MRDIFIFKAAHDLRDRVRFTNMREKLIAEAFALRRARHQTRDIDEAHNGGNAPFRLKHFRQHIESRIGKFHDAHVRFDRAERIVRRFRARFGNRVK